MQTVNVSGMMGALAFPLLITAFAAYFCGCFNGAVIVSKYILHDDVRTYGSGNAGLTNFYRTFGGPLTLVVISCDVLKAVAAVSVGSWLFSMTDFWVSYWPVIGKYVAGLFCLLGHSFPFGTWFVFGEPLLIVLGFMMGGLVVYMHRANIKRLLSGTESKFSFRKKKK